MARRSSGPVLPYRMLAGVVPCPGGWLALTGKLHGVTLVSDGAAVYEHVTELFEHKPAYDVVALHAPIGLPATSTPGGRACDHAARELLGWPRAGAVISAPPRKVLGARTFPSARRRHRHISPVEFALLDRIAEVDAAVHPYHQRSIHEVHPELSFHQLNGDASLRYPKHGSAGRAERRALVEPRIPGLEPLLERRLPGCTLDHRIDAAVALWTARRIAARGVLSIPKDPEWDERGLRMEIVR